MSRKNRLRRQNRLHAIGNPGPRDTRLSLSTSLMRDRNPIKRTLDRVRERMEPKDSVINQPADRLRQRLLVDRARRTAISRAQRLVSNNQNTGLISTGEFGKLQVDLPHNHPVCVKRRERREILFARGNAGKGAGKQRPPRRPELIIRCK